MTTDIAEAPIRGDKLPVKVALNKVVHTGSCNRVSWIGLQVRITLADGTDVLCEHGHGHRKRRSAIACAARLVARLNRAAGTSTAAVEAAKAQRKGADA